MELNTHQEFKKVNDLVLHFLESDIRCRNDDKWLTYRVMRKFTNIFIPFNDFQKLPAFETVKRCRAKIQNVEHKYPPTIQSVINRRQNRKKQVLNYLYSK